MANGTIKKVVLDRGFGFITGDDGQDRFFHRDSLVAPLTLDSLKGGEPVTFEVEEGPKGPRATQVTGA
ncbi:MAG: cold shock domain-containing protein [Chloroflexota bacterium]